MFPTAALACLFLIPLQQTVHTNMKRLAAGPGDYPARIVAEEVLIHFPEEGVWKPCRFNGEAWVAPKGAERKLIRVTGYFEEGAVREVKPGHPELDAVAWCDSPKGVGNGTYGRSLELADNRFTVQVWARDGLELAPYLDPFSADGPMVDVDINLSQSTPDGRGGRNAAGMAKLKAMVAYPSPVK